MSEKLKSVKLYRGYDSQVRRLMPNYPWRYFLFLILELERTISVRFRQIVTLFLLGLALNAFGSVALAAEKFNHLQDFRSNPAPIKDFSFPSTDGRTLSLQEMRGKVVLLAFFATWCPQCNSELPEFVHLQKQYRDRGFTVVAISIDSEPLSVVNQWAQRKRLNYPILHDRAYSVRASHNVKLIPTVYVLDRNLKMIAKVIGEINWHGRQAKDLFESLLGPAQ
ncbi:peroxiredoxin family protein [Pseudomonadota bacterium]